MISSLLALTALTPFALDIRDFGAVGDGTTMNTNAIQQALDKAGSAGKGVVVIPAGKFLSGTLHLRSHVELHLGKDAVLLGSASRDDYHRGVWFSFLIATKGEDISITGQGMIDGQGAALAEDILRRVRSGELKIPAKGWRPSELDRPEILEMTDCKKVRVEGVTIKNATCWVQTYRNCEDLTVKGIHVDSKTYWNNDGIDVVDCRNVLISNCDVDADDDGICLKSDDPKRACENVRIENCRIRSSASAIKFGTSSHGGFKKIRIKGIQVRDTFRSVVALESVDGAILEDVEVSNVKAVSTGNPFFIRLGHRTLKAPVGRVRHIILRDFDVQVPAGRPDEGYPFHGPFFSEPHNQNPSSIVGHPQFPIEDVVIERIKIRMPGGGTAKVAFAPIERLSKVPERVPEYPEFSMFGELPSWGLYLRHVHGLKIKDFNITVDTPDYRPAFVADDVSGLRANGLKVSGADPKPTFVVRDCKGANVGSGVRVRKVR